MTEDALNAALDEDPSDAFTRGVLADFYEEGDRPEDAERERWLIGAGRHPVYGRDMPGMPHRWDWFPDGWEILGDEGYDTAGTEPATLPDVVFDAIGDSHYPTRRLAEADLYRVRDVYEEETDAARPAPR